MPSKKTRPMIFLGKPPWIARILLRVVSSSSHTCRNEPFRFRVRPSYLGVAEPGILQGCNDLVRLARGKDIFWHVHPVHIRLGRKPNTNRPPGARTRASSADPALRLCQKYTVWTLRALSNVASGKGSFSTVPTRNSARPARTASPNWRAAALTTSCERSTPQTNAASWRSRGNAHRRELCLPESCAVPTSSHPLPLQAGAILGQQCQANDETVQRDHHRCRGSTNPPPRRHRHSSHSVHAQGCGGS